MIQGAIAVYYRELLVLRRRLTRLVPSWSVSPLLYLVAFGYAMGKHVTIDGHTYMEFLIPGLVAMSSMTQAFAISSEINIARFYWHIFEEIQAAPVSDISYVVGEVLAGMTRAILAILVILVLGLFCSGWCYPAISASDPCLHIYQNCILWQDAFFDVPFYSGCHRVPVFLCFRIVC